MPPGLHFIPSRPHLNIQFYENILISTHSVYFEHLSRENSSEIDYSKFKIQKILTEEEWCKNYNYIVKTPFTYKEIVISTGKPPMFISYHDYIDAWRNILFYQDPHHHSWYITFKQNMKTSFPHWWVLDWWKKFGPIDEIFPAPVKKQYVAEKLPLLQFVAKYSIPWILKWEYATSPFIFHEENNNITFTYLSQDISCKWWNKFNYETIFAPKTPIKLHEFPTLNSSFKEVVSNKKPSTSTSAIDSDLAQVLLAKIEELQNDNRQLRREFQQVSSRCSSTPSIHLSDDDELR
ncbi:hypothetical protein Scep_023927 [Stephania cephalantha]|uniref:Uncharacterized protein n=1 Tax=Stephania cephalantha TaxID=152367 RepID=A0AAP0HWP3_9MAGN